MNLHILTTLIIGSIVCLNSASAQPFPEGPLGDLYLAREGGLAHYSSADTTGGNDDRQAVQAPKSKWE